MDKIIKQELANQTSKEVQSKLGFNNKSIKDEEIKADIQNFLSREKAINSFKLIAKKRPIVGQEFCVIAYFLSDQITSSGSRGMWFLVGTYPRPDIAEEAAISLIEESGIKSIYTMKTCDWQDINNKFEPNRIKSVPLGKDKRLQEQHLKEYEKTVQDFKKEQEIADEIEKEQELEIKNDSVEYYTRQWFLAIKNKSLVEDLTSKLKEATNNMNLRINNIRDSYKNHPEYEDQWLEILREKLPRRGEENILKALEKGHLEMIKTVLPDKI